MKRTFIIVILTLTTLLVLSSGEISAQNRRNHIFDIPTHKAARSTGLFDLTEVSIGFGLQGNVQPNEVGFTGLTTLIGYWFTPAVPVGIGTGILAYNGSNCMPLYIESGYYFDEFGMGKMSLFIKADAGLLFRLNGNIAPTRVYGNPSIGMLVPVFKRKEISFSVGFWTQWETDVKYDVDQNEFNHFITAKVGFRFY